jgi:hypothetical protein
VRRDRDVAAVGGIDPPLASHPQRAGGHPIGLPPPLEALDDQASIGVVVEVRERLGHETNAVLAHGGRDVVVEQQQ